MYLYLLSGASTAAITAVLLRIFIPKLKSLKLGQPIYEIGPRWHKSKEGTPTMGGIFFIVAVIAALTVSSIIFREEIDIGKIIIVTSAALLFGLIGIVDDSAKLRKRENQGLTAPQKFLLQLIVAIAFVLTLSKQGYINTSLHIPFFDVYIELGVFYYFVAVILVCGIVNSVNLTDGIDGLASSVTAAVMIFFSVFSAINEQNTELLLSIVFLGACIGFLVYNIYPAKIFMGDTGSLFLGGAAVGMSFLIGSPLVIFVTGIVYVIETASVILQVMYFKATHGKRLFKMAPIHHHFEKCGFSENKIVLISVLVTALASTLLIILM